MGGSRAANSRRGGAAFRPASAHDEQCRLVAAVHPHLDLVVTSDEVTVDVADRTPARRLLDPLVRDDQGSALDELVPSEPPVVELDRRALTGARQAPSPIVINLQRSHCSPIAEGVCTKVKITSLLIIVNKIPLALLRGVFILAE